MITIDEFSFGKIIVNGTPYNNDVKIVGGHVVSNWWRRSGHCLDVEDVEDILAARPEVLVVGMGAPGLMKASESLRNRLEKQGVALVEETTDAAVKTFNRLVKQGKSVAAGFHVGC